MAWDSESFEPTFRDLATNVEQLALRYGDLNWHMEQVRDGGVEVYIRRLSPQREDEGVADLLVNSCAHLRVLPPPPDWIHSQPAGAGKFGPRGLPLVLMQ